MMTQYVELADAAEILGVHYQTAYRWIREGVLKAEKVGTRYRVHKSDLAAFRDARYSPIPPPEVTKVRDWEVLSQHFYTNLITGSASNAKDQFERLLVGGLDIVEAIEKMMAPALYEIGQEWTTGCLSVAVEHRASRICCHILETASYQRRGRPHGKVVVTTPVGDEHELPSMMATASLRFHHWLVQHLGSQVPMQDLVDFAKTDKPDFVVLSVTNPKARPSALITKELLEENGFRTIVGGMGSSVSELIQTIQSAHGEVDIDSIAQ